MLNPHEADLSPSDLFDYERHAADCACDFHRADDDESEPIPSQAELEKRYQYFLHRSA